MPKNQPPRTSKRTPPVTAPKSTQYDLFTAFLGPGKDLSNTIELWDAIPKYSVTPRFQKKLRNKETSTLPVYEQHFEYRPTLVDLPTPISCTVTIQPASVKKDNGDYIQYYPSTDEELLEEVLKKIFSDQQFGIHSPTNNESWVKFSLYMLQKELKARGKTRSIDQIKQSLEILSRAVYEVQLNGSSKKLLYTNPILSDLTRVTRSAYLEDPKTTWCARLPTLISKSVNELTYRQFNYGTLMSLDTQLSRWFYKRLTHQYINAGILQPYNFLFSSLKRDSGLLTHARNASNIETVDNMLKELEQKRVIMSIKKEVRWEGKKIIDVLYIITPTSEFTTEIKTANARYRDQKNIIDNTPTKTRRYR